MSRGMSMRAGRLFATGLGIALLTAASGAQTSSPIRPIQFSDTRLSNGLRVIISEDHFAPVYAIAVSYSVGSKDERAGRTGFAHLFEHMMFKGSDNIGPGEHFFLHTAEASLLRMLSDDLKTLAARAAPSQAWPSSADVPILESTDIHVWSMPLERPPAWASGIAPFTSLIAITGT